jgi:glycosyltransferase involved in cell wall biosynthesis
MRVNEAVHSPLPPGTANHSTDAGPRVLIIPAFNEGKNLEHVLTAIANAKIGFETVVIDDGSPDDTGAVATRLGATLIRHPFNLGYGAALQTGYKYALEADASLVVQMDADGQHDPQEIPKLIDPILKGECDLVVGSRFLTGSDYRMGFARNAGRTLFRSLARMFGLKVSDPTSGFQAMSRAVLEVYSHDFFPTDYPDVDVLLTAYRHGLRVCERPVRMSEGARASRLHGGLRNVYYVYKMLLSTWSASARGGRRKN